MPGPHTETLILINETCRQIAHGALAIEELGKRYDRTRAALEKAQQIIAASEKLMPPEQSQQVGTVGQTAAGQNDLS